jgi:hypothetical protein
MEDIHMVAPNKEEHERKLREAREKAEKAKPAGGGFKAWSNKYESGSVPTENKSKVKQPGGVQQMDPVKPKKR